MGKKQGIIIVTILLLILGVILFGPPTEIGFPSGFVWKNLFNGGEKTLPTETPQTKLPTYVKDAIEISSLTPRRGIYSKGENATVEISLYNPYNFQYNLSVYWINGEERFLGWSTLNNSQKTWFSWYPMHKKGEWIVNVIVKWEIGRTHV